MKRALAVAATSALLVAACSSAEPLSATAQDHCLGDGAFAVSIRGSTPAEISDYPMLRYDPDHYTFMTKDGDTLELATVSLKSPDLSVTDARQEMITKTPGEDALEAEMAAWGIRFQDWAARNPEDFEARCREVVGSEGDSAEADQAAPPAPEPPQDVGQVSNLSAEEENFLRDIRSGFPEVADSDAAILELGWETCDFYADARNLGDGAVAIYAEMLVEEFESRVADEDPDALEAFRFSNGVDSQAVVWLCPEHADFWTAVIDLIESEYG